MPWKSFLPLGERAPLHAGRSETTQHPLPCCVRTFGISRRCGYKWLERFRRDGRSGLHNRSARRPRRSPRRTPVRWRQAVRRLRQRFPHWGAKRFTLACAANFPTPACPPCAPSPSGCHGFVRCRPPPAPFPARTASDLAAVDPCPPHPTMSDGGFQRFLSHRRRHRCDPLTVRDLFQPLSPGSAHPGRTSARGRGAAGVYRPVPSLRFCPRSSPWTMARLPQHGRLGTFGLECWW